MAVTAPAERSFLSAVCLVGYTSVGKTSLLQRVTFNKFRHNYSNSIGLDFGTFTKKTSDGTEVKFQMWDSAGADRFFVWSPAYFRGKSAYLFCFDITKKETLNWVEELLPQNYVPMDNDVIKVLIGCKKDLNAQRTVSKEEAQAFADKHSFVYYECSSKEDTGINEMMLDLADRCLVREKERKASESTTIMVSPAAMEQYDGDWPCQC